MTDTDPHVDECGHEDAPLPPVPAPPAPAAREEPWSPPTDPSVVTAGDVHAVWDMEGAVGVADWIRSMAPAPAVEPRGDEREALAWFRADPFQLDVLHDQSWAGHHAEAIVRAALARDERGINARVQELIDGLEPLAAKYPGHVRGLLGAELCDRLLAALDPGVPAPTDEPREVAQTIANLDAVAYWTDEDGDGSGEFFRHDGYVLTVSDLRRASAALRSGGVPDGGEAGPPAFSRMPCPQDSRGCVDPEHCQQGGSCSDARRYAGTSGWRPVDAGADTAEEG